MKRPFHHRVPPRLWIAALVPFVLLGSGTLGFKIFGGPEWTWFDAMYMSAITLTTVGYGETHPLNDSGRLFAVFFLFTGVFLLFYSATEMIRAIVTGQLRAALGKESVKHMLEEIRDHIVVCGLGRMGRLICQQFDRQKVRYVVIDRNPDSMEGLNTVSGVFLHGDATEDEVLKRAGLERAKVLVASLPSDADNLYITLTGRVLSPNLFIVARAEQEASEPKLRRVGANQVVSPYVIGGHRVAQAVLRPTVGHFLEQAGRLNAADYQIEEAVIRKGSSFCGKSLRDLNLREEMGIVVLAIRQPDGELVFNPKGDSLLEPGSIMVAVGRREQLDELERIAAGTTKA